MLAPLRLFFFYLAAPTILAAVVLLYATSDQPVTQQKWPLTRNDIHKIKHILNGHSSNSQNLKTITLTEQDLNIAGHYLLNRYLKSTNEITLGNHTVNFKLSLQLPDSLFGHYLNLQFTLSIEKFSPTISQLSIGALQIADEFAGLIINAFISYTPLKNYYLLAAKHIKNLEITHQTMSITYLSRQNHFPTILPQTEEDSDDNKILTIYQKALIKIINQHDPDWRLSLADLLQPLFKLAYTRSTLTTAIEENKQVIFAISTYVNQKELQGYLPFELTDMPLQHYNVFLYKRIDLAKHFMTSAALTATGAGILANMLGQEKEFIDADRGSGFSFIDLAGDRAGMYFGEYATSSPQNARKLQKKMALIKDYRAFMPDVRDLPESMNTQQFNILYGSTYSPLYQDMLQVIDRRIASVPVYQ